jgi:hypothetical protein
MRHFSIPEAVAWEVPAKRLNVDGLGTVGTLTMTNRRMYWTRRQSLLSKTPAKPCEEIHWPEMAAIVEHRVEKHALFIAQRRGVADRLRFWVSGSDGDRMRRHLAGLGFDTHAWT